MTTNILTGSDVIIAMGRKNSIVLRKSSIIKIPRTIPKTVKINPMIICFLYFPGASTSSCFILFFTVIKVQKRKKAEIASTKYMNICPNNENENMASPYFDEYKERIRSQLKKCEK